MAGFKMSLNVLNFIPVTRHNIHYSVFYDDEEYLMDGNQVNDLVCGQPVTIYNEENDKSKSENTVFYFLKAKRFVKVQSRKLFSKKKFSRAWGTLQNKVENISRQFRTSNKQPEVQTPMKFTTPTRRTRHILGRTPIKLYSPFAIETPNDRSAWCHANMNWDESTPIKFGAVGHLQNANRKNSYVVRRCFLKKLVGKKNYYKI